MTKLLLYYIYFIKDEGKKTSQKLRRRRSSLLTIANGPPDIREAKVNPLAQEELREVEESEEMLISPEETQL